METLIVIDEFSMTPGARTPDEGPFSGQEFREDILLPRLKDVIKKGGKLKVDLDGSAGYGSSFLEEVFGGLIRNREIDYDVLKKTMTIKSDEDETYIEEINQYIEEAHNNL